MMSSSRPIERTVPGRKISPMVKMVKMVGARGADRGVDRSMEGLVGIQTGRGLMVTGVMMPG